MKVHRKYRKTHTRMHCSDRKFRWILLLRTVIPRCHIPHKLMSPLYYAVCPGDNHYIPGDVKWCLRIVVVVVRWRIVFYVFHINMKSQVYVEAHSAGTLSVASQWGHELPQRQGPCRATREHQWLKCNGTRGNAVPPPPIYGSKRSPTSDGKAHDHVRGPNLNVAFPHL